TLSPDELDSDSEVKRCSDGRIKMVEFEGAEDAQKVIKAVNGKYLLGRQVTVERFVPRYIREKLLSMSPMYRMATWQNIPAGMSAADLKELCENQVGKVIGTYTEPSGTYASYGVALFETRDDALKAVHVLEELGLEGEMGGNLQGGMCCSQEQCDKYFPKLSA
ncbi:hypothetical protein KIPB_010054, partial [Kipferlia bialata]